MAGVSAITGLSSAQFAAEVQIAAVARTKDALEQQGEAALKLIESASIDPDVGQNLNVSV